MTEFSSLIVHYAPEKPVRVVLQACTITSGLCVCVRVCACLPGGTAYTLLSCYLIGNRPISHIVNLTTKRSRSFTGKESGNI